MPLLNPANRRRIFPHSPWRPGKARNGKIARLPDKLRESINLLLLDGLTYEAIIAYLHLKPFLIRSLLVRS